MIRDNWEQLDIYMNVEPFPICNYYVVIKDSFTLAMLWMPIDIVAYVLNSQEHGGRNRSNQKRLSWCMHFYGFIAHTRMIIATYKVAGVNGSSGIIEGHQGRAFHLISLLSTLEMRSSL